MIDPDQLGSGACNGSRPTTGSTLAPPPLLFPEYHRPSNPLLGGGTLLAALLRELVKEMPADKRLSFQTRVANARTKEAVESVLYDYASRLECLVLPHARSGEIDLQQVKKVCL